MPDTRAAGGLLRGLHAHLNQSKNVQSCHHSQLSCESCSLLLGDDRLRRLAHNDHFLVGHHNHARQVREPNAHIRKSLEERELGDCPSKDRLKTHLIWRPPARNSAIPCSPSQRHRAPRWPPLLPSDPLGQKGAEPNVDLNGGCMVDRCMLLTFLTTTPHLERSLTSRSYMCPVGSVGSGLIWQSWLVAGSSLRSSAKMGAPWKPSGLRNLAFNWSSMADSPNMQLMSATS